MNISRPLCMTDRLIYICIPLFSMCNHTVRWAAWLEVMLIL